MNHGSRSSSDAGIHIEEPVCNFKLQANAHSPYHGAQHRCPSRKVSQIPQCILNSPPITSTKYDNPQETWVVANSHDSDADNMPHTIADSPYYSTPTALPFLPKDTARQPHQRQCDPPQGSLDFGVLERRFQIVNDACKTAGFDGIDAMFVEYYAARSCI